MIEKRIPLVFVFFIIWLIAHLFDVIEGASVEARHHNRRIELRHANIGNHQGIAGIDEHHSKPIKHLNGIYLE